MRFQAEKPWPTASRIMLGAAETLPSTLAFKRKVLLEPSPLETGWALFSKASSFL